MTHTTGPWKPPAPRHHRSVMEAALAQRVLVMDGGMGTLLQARNLRARDYGGRDYDGCHEHLNLSRPYVIREIHEAYLTAGADIVETNTFGATPLVLAEYRLDEKTEAINRAAALLAREVAETFEGDDRPRFVLGSMGPTTKSLSLSADVSFPEMVEAYRRQAVGLLDGGVDAFLIETVMDTLNAKAAVLGIRRAEAEGSVESPRPLLLSATLELTGTMLSGQSVEAFWISVEHFEPIAVGLNCSTGPEFMTHHMRVLSEMAATRVFCYPNAGLPDEEGNFTESPGDLARVLGRFLDNGWLNLVGGCCGTTPEHIAVIAEIVASRQPRPLPTRRVPAVSGVEALTIEEENRPILVGERTNVIGSAKFRKLIAAGKWEDAAEVGREQVKNGAQILDVCLSDPDRDERADMVAFLPRLLRCVRIPLMIDTMDPMVLDEALRRIQGKVIVNSINLEDGERRFAAVAPLARDYGAALVVGCIDDDPSEGMARTAERKLAVARRSFDLLTGKYGIPARDLIFDPLVFPVGTGDAAYRSSAAETLAGLRAIREALPETRTVLGISNVSFGLPPAARDVLHAVFLYHATRAGLDLALVNTEKLERYASLPEEDRRLAENLIFQRGEDPLGAFTEAFRGKDRRAREGRRKTQFLTLEERLVQRIVEGSRKDLEANLEVALKKYRPLEIINGPLMAGMDEVGRLFNANQLIVAEVLQSAEVMKAAVSFLEPHVDRTESVVRGKVVLATVKGDVHDIGKNLVEIILANNGFQIVNLGIKVSSEKILEAVREHKPDLVGLSGLLVKSAHQMVATVEDLRAAGVDVPVLVGGAALSPRFVALKIASVYGGPVLYARDAMQGLAHARVLTSPRERCELIAQVAAHQERLREEAAGRVVVTPAVEGPAERSLSVRPGMDLPVPPDTDRHIRTGVPLDRVWEYLNYQMLYAKHLGLHGSFRVLLEAGDTKARKLLEVVSLVQELVRAEGVFDVRGAFRFFRCRRDGDDLVFLGEGDASEVDRLRFGRQTRGDRLCLADFTSADRADHVAMFVTTCAGPVGEYIARFKQRGDYVQCHVLGALAIETAEAYAEMLHQELRGLWGFPDPPDLTMAARFRAKHRGVRFSFGYPACPRLEDQRILFRLLDPAADIGVRLTEGLMMEPEASVSALVLHHPDARYFSLSEADVAALEARIARTA